MGVIAAVAEFHRDLLIERTQSGFARAKSQGKTQGRPESLDEAAIKAVVARLAQGEAIAALTTHFAPVPASVSRGVEITAPAIDFPDKYCAHACREDLRLALLQILAAVTLNLTTLMSKPKRFRLDIKSLFKLRRRFMTKAVSRRFIFKGYSGSPGWPGCTWGSACKRVN